MNPPTRPPQTKLLTLLHSTASPYLFRCHAKKAASAMTNQFITPRPDRVKTIARQSTPKLKIAPRRGGKTNAQMVPAAAMAAVSFPW